MASTRPFLGEGTSINRPPSFNGECYNFWKIRMKIFIESQDLDVWDAIENGPYVPFTEINDAKSAKPRAEWTDEDKKKVQYDLRAKNILTSALGFDEFFRVSNCTTAKEMWDTLEVTHEGTEEVKRSRMNTLSQEYEMFRMKPGESILELQKRFTHLINHLISLGKDFSNSDLNLKVLRSLTRVWQPKVTAISEKKSLSKMTLAALFGKLQEHELELSRLEESEEVDKKKRTISLKAKAKEEESQQSETSSEEDTDEENLNLLVKRFGRFLKKNKNKRSFQNKFTRKNEASTSNPTITCFECGKPGHIKMECPLLKKKVENKNKKEKKGKRAYIAWEENDMESSSSSDEEVANLCLMTSHDSDEEVSDSDTCKPSYDDLQNAFEELHEECLKLSRENARMKSTISSLEKKNETLTNELDDYKIQFDLCNSLEQENMECEKCKALESKVESLNKTLANFTMSSNHLGNILNKQRNAYNRKGLGYENKNHPRTNNRNFFVPPKRTFRKSPTCFYCQKGGHTTTNCYIRKYGVPSGKYKWIKKGSTLLTNIKGPKGIWVPYEFF